MEQLSFRKDVFKRLEETAKSQNKFIHVVCNELLAKALENAKESAIPLYALRSGEFRNRPNRFNRPIAFGPVGGINDALHGQVKALAEDAGISMVDLASSLLASALGVTPEEIIGDEKDMVELPRKIRIKADREDFGR